MSKKVGPPLIEVKSKFDAEFRRFSVLRSIGDKFLDFYQLVESLHNLRGVPFVILYTDEDDDLLPINNNDNFKKALSSTASLLRIHIQRKDENWSDLIGYSTLNRKREKGHNKILAQLPLTHHSANKSKNKNTPLKIGMPEDFRQVSQIIDVDILPQTHRRVRLLKHGSDRPLGFYIRDGVSIKVTPTGLEKVPGIFISRLVPGGLAESTGILAVNDEVVEVNGIDVTNKTLDQVTDMMIANSSNLIITVKPANQRGLTASPSNSDTQSKSYNSPSLRINQQRMSQMSAASAASTSSYPSNPSFNEDEDVDDDMDEIRDLTGPSLGQVGNMSGSSGTGSDRPLSSDPMAYRPEERTGSRRESSLRRGKPVGQHVTKIILDGKNGGVIHKAEQVFTL
ncbi:Partitioning defective 6-like protein gamma [Hypsibius exemplaris]|uniref:Partitioning defective 6-like protein gamma n=1 Tax=Hypsibius exemplaris TaxID=2072580 RepID=A0A1W0WMD0_HYPEX|nr:Partitioning defective 6-like protein gamma [Hypsibius exemplaris]